MILGTVQQKKLYCLILFVDSEIEFYLSSSWICEYQSWTFSPLMFRDNWEYFSSDQTSWWLFCYKKNCQNIIWKCRSGKKMWKTWKLAKTIWRMVEMGPTRIQRAALMSTKWPLQRGLPPLQPWAERVDPRPPQMSIASAACMRANTSNIRQDRNDCHRTASSKSHLSSLAKQFLSLGWFWFLKSHLLLGDFILNCVGWNLFLQLLP